MKVDGKPIRKHVGEWSFKPINRRILIRSFFIITFLIFSYRLYCASLVFKTAYQVVHGVVSIAISCTLCLLTFTISIYMIFFSKELRKIHRVYLYLCSIFILFLIFIKDQRGGNSIGDFGYGFFASRTVIGVLLGSQACFLLLKGFLRLLRALKIRLRFAVLVFLALLLVLLFFYSYHYLNRKSINDRGLFGVVFDPEKSLCRIDNDYFLVSNHLPKFLTHKLLRTYWCSLNREFVEVLNEDDIYTKTTTVRIHKQKESTKCDIYLFPNLVDYYTYEELKTVDSRIRSATQLYKWFNKKSVLVENINKESYSYDGVKYETSLVSCNNGKDRNVIVNPRRKFEERHLKPASLENPNIILIWFDSESRKLFEYDFPESIRYIQNHIYDETISKKHRNKNKYDLYQFFSHHVIGWNTNPQFRVMFNGDREQKNFSYPLWEIMKHKGYLTVYTDDECNDGASRYNKNPMGKKMMFDYTHLEPFCLPEYTNPENPLDGFRGAMSAGRRCLIQKEGSEYVFDYLKKIEKVYPEKAKFIFAMIDEAHEATGESIRYVDRFFKDYLRFLDESGTLDKSIVFLFSDHGNHQFLLYNMIKEGRVGRKNPMLYIIKPKKYQPEYNDNLITNQHRIVTGLDLHKTWSEMVGWDWDDPQLKKEKVEISKNGINIMEDEVPFDRKCEQAGIRKEDCEAVICKKE